MFNNVPKKELHLFYVMAFFQICGLIGILFVDRNLTLSLTPQNLLITTFCIFFIYEDKIKMLRFFIIRSHYRSPQEYSLDQLIDAQNSLDSSQNVLTHEKEKGDAAIVTKNVS